MKKNRRKWLWKSRKRKFIFLLHMIFLIGGVLWGNNARASGQSLPAVSLNLKHVNFVKVIESLRQQTGYEFVFNAWDVEYLGDISFSVKKVSLEEALELLVKDRGLTYVITGQTVVFRKQKVEPKKKFMTVKGFVCDTKKQPLPGVTVKLMGMSVGTASDVKGWFRMTLPVAEGMLEFSFVGFKNERVALTEKNIGDTLRIELQEDIEALDEVVVTGYQVLKEKGMAGSYSRVKAEDLVMTGGNTVESMLQGKLPGVMITHSSGLTGTRQKVRVRGTSTLVGSADPVWVVDGIIQEDPLPFETSELGAIGDDNLDMMKDFIGGAISWLNPNDIEDITVLKDASATAIYGVKAANGVILITTKKGERGRMSVSYAGNFMTSRRMNYNRQEVMNSKERVALSREAYERGARVHKEKVGYMGLALAFDRREISLEEFNSGIGRLETVNTDWFDILYRTPFTHSHSLSFSGGNEDATYRASFGYRNVKNTAKGNELISYTGNLNTSMTFWEKMIVTASLSGSHTKTKAFASGVDPFNYAINTSRVIACYDEKGELFYYNKGGYNYNILNELANSGNENTQKSLTLNLNARWRLIEDLTLVATLGGTTSSSFAETWFTERSHKISAIRGYEYGKYGVMDDKFKRSPLPYGGMLTMKENRNFNYTARIQAEYVKLFNGVHSVNLMAGVETRSNKYDGFSQTNYGYMWDRGKSFTDVPIKTPAGDLNEKYARTKPMVTDYISNYISYYATAGYMYDNRYSINLSVRSDGSNAFGKNSKFQSIWSAGLRWNVTDEHWMENQNLVNNLAFTVSLGYQGNVVENIGPDFVAEMQEVDSETGEFRMTWSQLPNPGLKPEKTLSVNFGVNFALFSSKLNGTFNWYYKKTTDVITTAEVPYETGTTGMYLNDGHMENEGWDLAFTVVPVRTKNFMWSLGTSFSGNSNKVNSKIEKNGKWENAVSGSLSKKGYPVGSFWAFKFTGLDPEYGGPQFDLSRANTDQAAKDATEYMVYVGTREPTFTMGLNMVFRWKRFSFPLNVYFSRGNKEFLASPYEMGDMMMSEYVNVSDELNNRWRKPGDERFTNIPSIPVGENCLPLYPFEDKNKTKLYPLDAWKYSNVRVVNAWYIRFNDLKLSYSLPDKWIKSFADNLTLSVTMTNPLQIRSKDFNGRDPEVALGNQPRSQDFSFGIDMSF